MVFSRRMKNPRKPDCFVIMDQDGDTITLGFTPGEDETDLLEAVPFDGGMITDCTCRKGYLKMIETERLILREYTLDDFDALYEIVSDSEIMQHYPAPFDAERTRNWITWNLENYEKYGFGLWAVVLKETGEFIGDCGISMQNIDGEMLPEIGYHIHKKYWRKGFGKEAARASRDWLFQNTDYDIVYSYMKYTNVGSYSTAMANGMKKIKEYADPKNTISYVYAISREEWELLHEQRQDC